MEFNVTIAIPDVAGAAALAATLASVARHTLQPLEVVLLVEEGAPPAAGTAPALRRVGAPVPFAVPAGLNRLLAAGTAAHVVLLESGAIVTAGWLERLLVPLRDRAVGLSGPSTNRSWNEQQVLPRAGGASWTVAQIEAFAATIAEGNGDRCVPLDTLHSLGDFCYLFRREVADRLGGFDEAYGAGPCWEIDFSTRAARAGFGAVWVAAAYVHRRSPLPAQVATLRRLFTASKHLYQDRFCGPRLRGEKPGYEAHCLGEACEQFAPPALIRTTLPSAPAKPAAAATTTEAEATPGAPPAVAPGGRSAPLVSCIMPTRDRLAFLLQSIRYFQRQDYPERELIVVDDGIEDLGARLPDDDRIRYVRAPRDSSIGAKRNEACRLARGAFIAHWDDDDWYGPGRLTAQLMPLVADDAEISGLRTDLFFDVARWEFWRCTPDLHRRLFTGDVHGGTLVYQRRVWERLARYPDRSLAEDAAFLRRALHAGARLHRLSADGHFIYLRHGANAWTFPLGDHLEPRGWHRAAEPELLRPDRAFYGGLSHAAGASVRPFSTGDERPLVSCIMPTADRRPWLPRGVRYFQDQDYPHAELIVVDDGADAVADLIPDDPRVRYVRLAAGRTLGAKRNAAVEAARGDLIMHWDDDDWMAPHRIRYQVEALCETGADACGLRTMLFHRPADGRTWLYDYPAGRRQWVAGASLLYTRSFWRRAPFPPISVGEDTRFLWDRQSGRVVALPDHRFYVAMIHGGNTSPKISRGAYWSNWTGDLREVMGADLTFYESLRDGRRTPQRTA
jgi:glycosyltransferase involved in cell wall biosynthesis